MTDPDFINVKQMMALGKSLERKGDSKLAFEDISPMTILEEEMQDANDRKDHSKFFAVASAMSSLKREERPTIAGIERKLGPI